ncbi:MAG: glycine cleavage system protein T [Flavobacteriaceae bacterium]|nr:glycine cleavage system protein T [Flavobacteriaceae bacterium]
MKQTALHEIHKALGARMVPFAGYEMPVQYDGVKAEHLAVRNSIGVFDVSHMGEFLIEGPYALNLVQSVCSNDAARLVIGQAQYSCFPNSNGGIVDDLIVYRLEEAAYLMVVNACNIKKDWNWIQSKNLGNVKMKNLSDDYSLLAIQGPVAVQAMQPLSNLDLSAIKFYHFKVGDFAGIDRVIISATGYTGSGGFEIYCKNKDVKHIWNSIFEAGNSFGIKPIGLAARDTLRLEMGYCLYGNDIDDNTSPIEAGLGWITKFSKNFTNSENLQRELKEGVKQKLIAFELLERGIPRKGYDIIDAYDLKIGTVTSGTMSPSLRKGIGMGYVKTNNTAVGTPIYVKIRKKIVAAVVVKIPFYKP